MITIWVPKRLVEVGLYNVAARSPQELAALSEQSYRDRVKYAAEKVRLSGTKIVMLTGPSASGKTTSAHKLAEELIRQGTYAHVVSLDNFFRGAEFYPRLPDGTLDYENPDTMDLPLVRQCLHELSETGRTTLPIYDFANERRSDETEAVDLQGGVCIVEGIHALNPELTRQIPAENKYKIYVSALTTISLDDHNWIPTTDNRLLRRIIRDFNYRGYSAQETISRWPSVRAGEDKWIFPYQENADAMFNSSLLFELAVMKDYAQPILSAVPHDCPEYAEAHRLLRFLGYFQSINQREIPPTSLLREFLGGSSFKY